MKRIMIVIGISVFFFSTLVCKKTPAQEQSEGQWITYTTSDGLPYDIVAAIAFGPDGELWCVPIIPDVGAGVAHFNGNTWKHYTTKDGLGADFIIWYEHTLTVSSAGVLWVAKFGGGVSRFDGESWTTYTTENGLLADKVTAVAIAPNGDLWCAHPVPDCGISHFDGKTWTFYTTSDIGLTFCNLLNIAFDPDGTLWATGSNFVLRYDGETWTKFSSEVGLKIPVGLYMDIGPDGKVWISGGGVSCYDGSAWSHHSFEEIGAKAGAEVVVPLAVDSENVLWVGVLGEGVFRYDGKSWTKFAPKGGPVLNNVLSIAVGPDGALWFGTNVGISRYQPSDGN
jgi:ligand-binding sensor domain-containing protein